MQESPGGAQATTSVLPHNFDALVEAEAWGEADADQLVLLEQHREAWIAALDDLLDATDDAIDQLHGSKRPERQQAVADLERELARYEGALDRLLGGTSTPAPAPVEAPGEVRLQGSWAGSKLVVWGAGPGTAPSTRDELDALLEDAGAPSGTWTNHQTVPLPTGTDALALSSPVGEALGWLAAIGADEEVDRVGASLRWLGKLAVWAVQLVAGGAVVPTLRSHPFGRGRKRRSDGRNEYSVRWVPALVDEDRLDALVAAMPGPVAALPQAPEPRALALAALGSMVDAIATQAARMLELPAPPPEVHNALATAEAFVTRLDGSRFEAPARNGGQLAKRIDKWAHPATAVGRGRLVVQLDPPDSGGAWYLSVLGPDPDGSLAPIEVALVESGSSRFLADQLTRLERLLPVLLRPGGRRRGEVFLSQDEAWELMTLTGPLLEAAGFDVRVPALSRRRPNPMLRLTAEPGTESKVGANQLADVRWSAVFDDVELTAAEIAKLAAQARPLVRSHGRWVELDKADLAEAAAALHERSKTTQLTGAEVLRHALGLEGSGLSGGISVAGSGWAAELLDKASRVSAEPETHPKGFEGELRAYQAEALAWLGFLDSVELGGCLALDMGLGKTPTILAHLAGRAGAGPALVVAPPAVVGNWAAEAARFTPSLSVLVHHGPGRAAPDEFPDAIAGADVVITTYGTAVRDIDPLGEVTWDRVVLDEAQAIKNPANETAQQLRRLNARVRVALTGTPIENGLGDLWAILDWANPGLVGTRSAFVSQLSAEGDTARSGGEHALRALNGILVFRRTKNEPEVAAELPDRIDELAHCSLTPEQIGLYQAVLDRLVAGEGEDRSQGEILSAITALKQICNHPAAYQDDDEPLEGRSGKLARLMEIVESVFENDERVLVFTHFAEWGKKLAEHLTTRTGVPVECYHGGLARGVRDRIIQEFQEGEGKGALVLSLKAGGTGLNLTAANHVVLYDRWWNPAVEDQARDRAWRIGQTKTVVCHRLVCPGTVDERVEEVVAGKRRIADLVLPKSSSLADLDSTQLRTALGLRPDELLTDDDDPGAGGPGREAA